MISNAQVINEVRRVYETDGNVRCKRVAFGLGERLSGAPHTTLEFATFAGSAYDCDGDEVPFIVQAIVTPHYTSAVLYQGANQVELEIES